MSDTDQVTKKKANEVLSAVLGVYREALQLHGVGEPVLQEPGIQCSGWAIVWEEGPYEWPLNLTLQEKVKVEGAFLEPVNHVALGVYPE